MRQHITEEEFEQLVAEGFNALPQEFRDRIENLSIRIEEDPSPETLAYMGITPPGTLLGLFTGASIKHRAAVLMPHLPDAVTLYRGPILDSVKTMDELREQVCEVLWHELGHYFGMNEREIREAQGLPWPAEGYAPDA